MLAFRYVEVRVRELAGIGGDVTSSRAPMAEAFRSEPPGLLVDPAQPKAEREATLGLFTGAMGRFRNPGMHADVGLDDPSEAAELIAFASVLLRLAERGAAAGAAAPGR